MAWQGKHNPTAVYRYKIGKLAAPNRADRFAFG